MEPIAEISNTALHKGISRITIKGIVTPDTKTAKDLLHIQEQTLSSPRISKNWDFIVGVLVLGMFLQIPTPQSDQRDMVEDTREEGGEGKYVGGQPRSCRGVLAWGGLAER